MEVKRLTVMKILAQKKWSIKYLSNVVPMNYIYLVNILNKKSNPSEVMAYKIADALEVEIEDIFEFELKEV